MSRITRKLVVVVLLFSSVASAQSIAEAQRAPQSFFRDKSVLVLLAAHGAATFADVAQTEHNWKIAPKNNETFTEHDPLMRPLVGHPVAYYSVNAAIVLGTAWLAHRWRNSSHPALRALWRLPQMIGTGSAITGIASSSR